MPELREDRITGRRVIIATERLGRPQEFAAAAERVLPLECPFCAGHEALTPPAVLSLPDPERADRWRVRVTPNKYPALTLLPQSPARPQSRDSAYSAPAVGAHEVVIESPDHLASITSLSTDHLADVFAAYAARTIYWKEQTLAGKIDLEAVLIFKNNGSAAGASLEHLHSQLTALPFIPPALMEELQGAERQQAGSGQCIYCTLIAEETAAGVRVVEETQNFLAFCPFASRFPLETWVLPKQHASCFEHCSPRHWPELAGLLQRLVGRLEKLAPRPAFNYWIHSAPFRAGELNSYHWHLELAPRLTALAGLELGSGVHLNPLAPEEAARRLREIDNVNG